MTFGSVCSGIEAASVAWSPLGWRCAFVSEIDAFPCALLRHYYPDVPNFGDLNAYEQWPAHAIDVLVGGTPCQDFSVAGQRAGLGGARGGLTMRFLDCVERFAPTWVVWENVPGVLSIDAGAAFGAFLGGLAKRGYGFAYRVLDAQYFGLAQRRERVFVVGCAGGQWQRAAAVLFDAPRLRWNPPPSRQARERVAPVIGGCSNGGGANGPGRDVDSTDSLVEVARSVRAQSQSSHREDSETYVPVVSGTIRSGSDSPAAHNKVNGTDRETLIAHTLSAEGHDASEDGTGRGVPLVCQDSEYGVKGYDTAGSQRAGRRSDHQMLPVAFQEAQTGCREYDSAGAMRANGPGHDPVGTRIRTGMAVRRLTPREVERLMGFPDDYTLVPYRGKPACDGPRYRALGNSMAVPLVRWLGKRIELVTGLRVERGGRKP